MEHQKVKPPRELECPHCGWKWKPRVEEPKYCPGCKRTLKKTEKQITKEQERKLITVGVKKIFESKDGFINCQFCDQPAIAKIETPDGKVYVCKAHATQKLAEQHQPDVVEATQIRLNVK